MTMLSEVPPPKHARAYVDFQEAELVPGSAGAAQKLSTVMPRHDCLAATPWQDGTGDRMQSDQGLLPGLP